MGLNEILKTNRDDIVTKWFILTVETYPDESQKHFREQMNPFANPVGGATREGLGALFDILTQEEDPSVEQVFDSLDRIIRMRAVQNFTPDRAVGFSLFLKNVVRDALGEEIRRPELVDELLTFNTKIDKLALQSFNIYMQCREKIYELKANELRNRTTRILRKASEMWDTQEKGESDQ